MALLNIKTTLDHFSNESHWQTPSLQTPNPQRPISGSSEATMSPPQELPKSEKKIEKEATVTVEEIKDQPTVVKRGWRFYGTFACLALLNFICAIDATILSVALPVRSFLLKVNCLADISQDNCY